MLEKQEINPEDFQKFDWYSFYQHYQSDTPVIAIHRLSHLPWSSVNLFAPKGQAMLAFQEYGVFYSAIHDWISGIVDDEEIYRSFMRELRQLKLKKASSMVCYLGDYTKWGGYGNSESSNGSFATDGSFALELFSRHHAMSVPTKYEKRVIDYFESQIKQFGKLAFFKVPEEVRLYPDEPLIEQSKESPIVQLFTHPRISKESEREEIEKIYHNILFVLEEAVENLEAGRPFDLDMPPSLKIRPWPDFYLSEWSRDQEPTEIEALLLSYRARFVRLLKWPWMYDGVSLQLEEYGNLKKLNDKFKLPYDICGELNNYFEETERRYPVIVENPLDGL